jgi:hypothetical protein
VIVAVRCASHVNWLSRNGWYGCSAMHNAYIVLLVPSPGSCTNLRASRRLTIRLRPYVQASISRVAFPCEAVNIASICPPPSSHDVTAATSSHAVIRTMQGGGKPLAMGASRSVLGSSAPPAVAMGVDAGTARQPAITAEDAGVPPTGLLQANSPRKERQRRGGCAITHGGRGTDALAAGAYRRMGSGLTVVDTSVVTVVCEKASSLTTTVSG